MANSDPRKLRDFASRFRIAKGAKFRLSDIDPADTANLESADSAEKFLEQGRQRLADLQEKLFAQDRYGVLLIFQAMDAAGKDGTIKHVMSGVDPQGVQVHSFKAPSNEELDHDFMWRAYCRTPERGRIGIFNRSYYEDVLVVRVHPEILAANKLPESLVTKKIWEERFEDIAAFERYLARNGYLILKFHLHVSREEQKRRFLSRLEEPAKNWKFSAGDVKERASWNAYMAAYEDMIRNTAGEHAPWYVVPADHKWFTRMVVAAAIVDALDGLELALPKIDAAKRRELESAKRMLVREKG
jgi:PPK2 family polyphosphate:nucleotide phosphotransferase